MDPLTMVGAWAGAILAIAALTRMAYRGMVKAIRNIFQQELSRVWRDMDDIEKRLSALEASMKFMREQLEELRRMMQEHVGGG
jgi:chromosome segregation ATPase